MHTDPFHRGLVLLASLALLAPRGAARVSGDGDDEGCDSEASACEETARALRQAGESAARADYWVGVAGCLNLLDRGEARECQREKRQELREALELVDAQYDARLDLCEALGGGPYAPSIDPADFVADVTNPFFPLTPGTTKVFEGETEDGLEHIETSVTHEREEVLGVECTVVHDVAFLDGVVIEDTLDYYAQDRFGNVWYFGELSMSFEDGQLVSLAGSWRAGVDGALPGILMEAAPRTGDTYRQEFLPDVAEDAASVTGLGRTVHVTAGTFDDCLETFDFTPLEPDQREAKFYAPGVGVVLEIDLESGEQIELVATF